MNRFQTDVIARGALEAIIQERIRQTLVEGYTPAHDDQHTDGQLALLAAAYALSSRGAEMCYVAQGTISICLYEYGWRLKTKDPIRDLTRAGALIVAELERLLRSQDPVSRAITEGLLQESQRGWAKEFFNRDPAGFRGYVERTER